MERSKISSNEDLCFTSAVDLAAAYRKRELSPVDVVKAILARADAVEPRINCLVTRCDETALEQAKAAEAQFMSASDSDALPALLGIPVTVKDLEKTAGVRTTYGSRHFEDYVPEEDAPIWARLKAAGAILIGKSTSPEFGLHSTTDSLLTGITNNPWDVTRSVGGSSGGAAAALAAGIAPLATGSDGGGSIRVPASFCGVVGLKATPGRIPYNTRDDAYDSVTVVGPMTRTVRDCALMFDTIAGHDPYDAMSWPMPGNGHLAALKDASIRGLRVAYCPDLRSGPMERQVREVVTAAVSKMERELGVSVNEVELTLPDPYDYFAHFWGPMVTKFYDEMLEPLGNPEFIPPGVMAGVEAGRNISLSEYVRYQYGVRTELRNAFADIFSSYDLLVWPTTPCVAYPHPSREIGGPTEIDGQTTRHPSLENQRFTEAISHAGYPAISVPAGFDRNGLPVGLQMAAPAGAEALLLKAAASFEAVAPWAQLRPKC